tara:strand:- start:48 stop:926 length:879 start_codon:yes stop_codon:yes gene_type:complete
MEKQLGGLMNPKFPIYIVSKGRSKNGLTWKALDEMKVRYMIIVEPEEYNEYAERIDESKLIICPKKYRDEYDTFWTSKTTGPGSARNFAWADSIKKGYSHHWVMDDNLDAFHRLNRNIKAEVTSGTIFKCMEDFTLRYENVALSGPNYYSFCKATDAVSPYILNTRIYSCLFIRNDIPYRWRGKYNEDTDLSLRVLKDGWCTIQFNAFLQGKVTTQRMSGGNHQQFYSKEGTINKSKMLEEMHPDVAKVVWKFNRWHHVVNYKQFKKNYPQHKNIKIPKKINNYGMRLSEID